MGWGRLGDGGGILLVDKLRSVPFNRIWMACLKAGTGEFWVLLPMRKVWKWVGGKVFSCLVLFFSFFFDFLICCVPEK